MEIIKIKSCKDIETLMAKLGNQEITVDLSECDNNDRTKVMYFLSGATFNRGVLKKINKNQFVVSLK